jgi:hypothetical protein
MGTYNESSKYEKSKTKTPAVPRKHNGSEFKNLTSPQTIPNQTKKKRPTGSK